MKNAGCIRRFFVGPNQGFQATVLASSPHSVYNEAMMRNPAKNKKGAFIMKGLRRLCAFFAICCFFLPSASGAKESTSTPPPVLWEKTEEGFLPWGISFETGLQERFALLDERSDILIPDNLISIPDPSFLPLFFRPEVSLWGTKGNLVLSFYSDGGGGYGIHFPAEGEEGTWQWTQGEEVPAAEEIFLALLQEPLTLLRKAQEDFGPPTGGCLYSEDNLYKQGEFNYPTTGGTLDPHMLAQVFADTGFAVLVTYFDNVSFGITGAAIPRSDGKTEYEIRGVVSFKDPKATDTDEKRYGFLGETGDYQEAPLLQPLSFERTEEGSFLLWGIPMNIDAPTLMKELKTHGVFPYSSNDWGQASSDSVFTGAVDLWGHLGDLDADFSNAGIEQIEIGWWRLSSTSETEMNDFPEDLTYALALLQAAQQHLGPPTGGCFEVEGQKMNYPLKEGSPDIEALIQSLTAAPLGAEAELRTHFQNIVFVLRIETYPEDGENPAGYSLTYFLRLDTPLRSETEWYTFTQEDDPA